MNKYDLIISDMTWSYSRVGAFEMCPYSFYLRYIKKEKGVNHFFSDYGIFMHSILQKFYNHELKQDELAEYYLSNFKENVETKAPTPQIFPGYFNDGLSYLQQISYPQLEVIGVEKSVNFKIDKYNFTGYIDLILKDKDGKYVIVDHKSKKIEPRNLKKPHVKANSQLDKILSQLFLYSWGLLSAENMEVKALWLNVFRSKIIIKEPFNLKALNSAKENILNSIHTIENTQEWKPIIEPFKCKHICSMCNVCEYYRLSK